MLANTALAALLLVQASSGAAIAQPAQNSAPNPSSVQRGEPITLNFENAEIEAVARTMATITGRNVVVDPRVRGTINLVTEGPVSPQSAFDQFLVALRLQGFTMVEAAGLYKVLPEADAKLQSGSVYVSEGAFPKRAPQGGQIVTQIFRLNYENASNLIPTLRPLISPNNTINVNPATNSLVITDYADNLARMAKIIAALDVSEASDIEIIPLHYAIASEIVPLLTRLVGGDNSAVGAAAPGGNAGQAASGQSFRTTILADVRSNAVIVRAANPARVSQIRSLVSQLDRAPAPGSSSEFGNMHVVFLKNANATQLAQTLRAAIAAGNIGSGAAGAGAGGIGTGSTGISTSTSSFGNDSSSTGNSSGLSSSGSNFGESSGDLGQVQAPSTGGIIQADPSTNSLIITAPDALYRQLRPVIDKLDSRRAQVLIESMVVEVRADKAAEFGIQWQAGFGNSGSSNVGAIGTNYSGTGNIIDLAISAAALASGKPLPPGVSAPSSSSIGNGINFGAAHNYGGTFVLGFLARFLEGTGDANVLSTPNILTLDNEEARILIGSNVPFPTGQYTGNNSLNGSVNPFTTIERQDVGISLRVKPQINEHGSVKLAVVQEVSDVVAGTLNSTNGPTTSKRLIETNVLVDDGGIIVLGGLLEDRYAQNQEKVPLLGDIPLLGNAFRSESRSREKVNLMVFLRPTVVYDAAGTDALAMERYNMMRQDQGTVQPGRHLLLDSVPSAPQLPELSRAALSDKERQANSKRRRPPLAELSRYPQEERTRWGNSGVDASDLRTGESSGWVEN
ncbi:type II secretion system protein GspD [Lampropedia aestuarii]|uniref:Type II secretion system protein GspD n=1 Tax=Lampropedia aestuarii TaxID=2562762 RepID=A0A4S5BRT6_9BURK|nr:type II secretion system secretin GspD [Lampropedia aestuarii]THJ35300.1 type II secretion system protein GspD [Lampropedia aestuarii]